MKKVLFYAFLLPAFVGMMFSCSDVKTDVKKLQAGFKKFNYEAEFVKETKQDGRKTASKNLKKRIRRPIRSNRTNTRICLFIYTNQLKSKGLYG